ncbi:kelch-like protein 12 [Clavelina lepadiformis]|uniref:kelch-like protein 12 n=1 Tax=Clavelina lepadiformis TaxID=159417 RepID=UPI0040426926
MSFESTIQQQSMDFSSNHALEILNKMNVERKSTQAFCDVTIKTDDGDFSAHKCVLSAFSEFYSKMFSSEMKKKLENEVSIKGVSSDIMDLIMEFIYTCKITLTTDNVFDVLAGSEQLQIPYVKEYCSKFLLDNMNETLCLNAFTFARMYHLTEVVKRSEECIFDNLLVLLKKDNFKSLGLNDLLALFQVNERPDCDEDLYDALTLWIKHDLENRKNNFCELFKNLCLENLSFCFLNELVVTEELVMKCHRCSKALISSLISPPKDTIEDLSRFVLMGGEVTNDVIIWDMQTQQSSIVRKLNCKRCASAAITLDGNQLCLMGGKANGKITDLVEGYYLEPESFECVLHPCMLERRSYFAACVLNDIIYVSGSSSAEGSSSCELFDRKSNKWSKIGKLNKGRGYHGMVALNEKLYVAGGFGGQNLSSAECFDPSTNVWKQIPSMNERRQGLCLVVFLGKMIALGGYNGNYLSSTEIYNPKTGSWLYGAPLNVARYGACAGVVNGKIYVIGGKNNQGLLTSVEMYDPVLGAWELFGNIEPARVFSSLICI